MNGRFICLYRINEKNKKQIFILFELGRAPHTTSEILYSLPVKEGEDETSMKANTKNLIFSLNKSIRYLNSKFLNCKKYSGSTVKNINSIIIAAEISAFINYAHEIIELSEIEEFSLIFLITEKLLALENKSLKEALSYIYSVLDLNDKKLEEGKKLLSSRAIEFYQVIEYYLSEKFELDMITTIYPDLKKDGKNVYKSNEYKELFEKGILLGDRPSYLKNENTEYNLELLQNLIQVLSICTLKIIATRCKLTQKTALRTLRTQGDRIIGNGISYAMYSIAKAEKEMLWAYCMTVKELYSACIDEYTLFTLMHVNTYHHSYIFRGVF